MKKYTVYKISCLSFYYIGVTGAISTRIDEHFYGIKRCLMGVNKNITPLPFYNDIVKEYKKLGVTIDDALLSFKMEVLRETKSRLRSLGYEQHYIMDCIEDEKCSNIFRAHACKTFNRVCVTHVTLESGEEIKANFCMRCGHSIKT